MQNEPNPADENARLRGDLMTVALRMSHDLRTPLGGIVTATEVLKEMLAEKDMPVTLTQTIFDSVDDMGRLIKQINFILRATAGTPPRQSIQMRDIVAAALQRLESRILKKQAIIAEPASWPQINGVAPWLEEVWWNLIANALQHTTDKPRIELSWQEGNGRYRFQVCDNGGGVPEEMRGKLFRPFHELHKLDGTRGLGLSIVQRLIDLQGGDCGYEPKTGGSCFFFTLPAS